jgi:hypothetical protein
MVMLTDNGLKRRQGATFRRASYVTESFGRQGRTSRPLYNKASEALEARCSHGLGRFEVNKMVQLRRDSGQRETHEGG